MDQVTPVTCASAANKPDGVTIWRPNDIPKPLFESPLDIPGAGSTMQWRPEQANRRRQAVSWR
jgi:hypothetical protein